MNTKAQILVMALLCAACIGLGAMWQRGCARSTGAAPQTKSDTIRIVQKVVDSIRVTRWRTITRTENRIDTAYIVADAGDEPASAEPIGDTSFVRNGTLLTKDGGEVPVGWNEQVTVSYGAAGFRLEFSETPLIVPDVDVCPPVPEAGHGFWEDVLYVASGIGVGALVIAILSAVR